jgi:hypothetical protein
LPAAPDIPDVAETHAAGLDERLRRYRPSLRGLNACLPRGDLDNLTDQDHRRHITQQTPTAVIDATHVPGRVITIMNHTHGTAEPLH